jgi:hypothetical protein
MKNFHQDTAVLCYAGENWCILVVHRVFNSALLISSQCLLFSPHFRFVLVGDYLPAVSVPTNEGGADLCVMAFQVAVKK